MRSGDAVNVTGVPAHMLLTLADMYVFVLKGITLALPLIQVESQAFFPRIKYSPASWKKVKGPPVPVCSAPNTRFLSSPNYGKENR